MRNHMHLEHRTPAILLIALLVTALMMLGACTRTRSPVEETPVVEVLTPLSVQTNGGDPEVSQSTPIEEAESTPTPEATSAPEEEETFQYLVEAGDTLASIAAKFATDLGMLRELNFLTNDSIYVGQPLQVPHRPGISQAGLPTATPEPFYHVVQADDTLSSISVQYDVSFDEILAANTIPDPDIVPVGTQLLIPGYRPPSGGISSSTSNTDSSSDAEAATDDAAGTVTGTEIEHIVQPNESLGEIAEAYGVDINELATVNNITNRNILRVGQRLTIPGVTEIDVIRARGQLHVVQPGEGLLSIAAQYGIDPDRIIEINGIENPDIIPVGQELLIPPTE